MSMGTIAFLQDAKIKIPDQVAIIGFDDYDWGKITVPPLSVIKQPSFELGKKAAEVLIERINDPSRPFEEYRLPTELTIRSSC